MSDQTPQSYANHARYVPLYHFVLGGLLGLYFIWALHNVIRWPEHEHVVDLLLAVSLLLMYAYIRVFPSAVQNRVIRLEEQLRYQRVLPADLQGRTGALTLRQIIGLRFAGDDELPGLVRKALDERLSEKQIKQLVKNWRADHLRA